MISSYKYLAVDVDGALTLITIHICKKFYPKLRLLNIIIILITIIIIIIIIIIITSNNQRLGSAFNDLDTNFSLLCQIGDDVIRPCKICGDSRYASQDPFVQCCPIQSRLQVRNGKRTACSYRVMDAHKGGGGGGGGLLSTKEA